MATITYPSLPSTNGATIIQTSNFVLANVYEQITYEDAMSRAKSFGLSAFHKFPGKDPGPSYRWFVRNNLPAGGENLATIICIRGVAIIKTASPVNNIANVTRTNLSLKSWVGEVTSWSPVKYVAADGQIYHDVAYHRADGTVYLDNDTQYFALPTNGYQMHYEVMNFFLKPVAANVPDVGPSYKLITGRNPLG